MCQQSFSGLLFPEHQIPSTYELLDNQTNFYDLFIYLDHPVGRRAQAYRERGMIILVVLFCAKCLYYKKRVEFGRYRLIFFEFIFFI